MNAWVAGSADLVFDLIRRHGIECEAEQHGWLQPAHAASRMAGVRAKHDQWARRGAPVEMLDGSQTASMTGSDYYRHGGWMHRSGGHIQPLGYARGLAHAAIRAGVRLHDRSPAEALERTGTAWRVRTPGGTVTAGKIILATNAYTGDLWPGLRQTIVPVRTFHAATRPLGDNVRATILPGGHGLSDTRQALWAFRLDRSGRLITTAAPLFTIGARTVLNRSTAARIAQVFPQVDDAAPEHIWEGNIAMTVDRLPRYHELADGLFAGLGYSGRGIAIGTAMGKLMAGRATGLPREELPVPEAPLRRLPAHGLIVPLSRAMLLLYRWRDGRA
jgi:glycine/D-amino acid oxidase-like deaminating enzyme